MNNFPSISDHSTQKINSVFKQTKTKKQYLKQPENKDKEEGEGKKTPSDENENTDGLLDIYA